MDDRQKQIPPPKSWMVFEDLCHRLFKAIWGDPLAHKHGRNGQAQHGVDVFGSPGGRYGSYHGVQCKGKEAQFGAVASLEELRAEILKAEQFEPPLVHWVFATTAPVDAELQREAREISEARQKAGRFTVTVLGWGDIETLLCEHRKVFREMYPELAFDVAGILERLEGMPHGSQVQQLLDAVGRLNHAEQTAAQADGGAWQRVEFGAPRDLGPALMGRPLGPRDVAACPELEEVDTVVAELRRAYSVRIVGEPGAGKSICAFQVARRLATEGWTILKLREPGSFDLGREGLGLDGSVAFLVDDAHLVSPTVLAAGEAATGLTRYLISIHHGIGRALTFRGAVVIDAKRAVRTIAASLRANALQTLEAVRRIDDEVGESMLTTPIEDRIDHAERSADFPWQFCFILGGGWRRAKQAADVARARGADIALAAAAIHQLASRDARPELERLVALAEIGGMSAIDAAHAFQWLVQERLLVTANDLRCPHQRFGVAVLGHILAGQDREGCDCIGRMLCHIVADAVYPIAGLRLLLREFAFVGGTRFNWTHLIPPDSLTSLIERCREASNAEERTFASLCLSELKRYNREWPVKLLSSEPFAQIIVSWIDHLESPLGYGVARLLHDLRNQKEPELARRLLESASADSVAKYVSVVTPKSAFDVGEFLVAAGIGRETLWGARFLSCIERGALLQLAKDWPTSTDVSGFVQFCHGLVWTDEDLVLEMVEAFAPVGQRLLADDPIGVFRSLMDLAWHVLRIVDPLGVYKGECRAQARHRQVGGLLVRSLDPRRLATQLSASRSRDFQTVSHLLLFLKSVVPGKFKAVVAVMDWNKISASIGEGWQSLPHDAEVLVAVAFGAGSVQDVLCQMVEKHLRRTTAFPPRLALLMPSLAYDFVEKGGIVRLGYGGQFEWRFAAGIIAAFSRDRPHLLEGLLRPFETMLGRAFSGANRGWYEGAADLLTLLIMLAPESLQRSLDTVDVVAAGEGWSDSLARKGGARRAVAVLVEASLARTDGLGDLARRLRLRFPSASVPQARE